jgi:DNA gyrase subunit B
LPDPGAITVIPWHEAIRRRTKLSLLDTGPRGLHTLLDELVGNSIREVRAGPGRQVVVTLHADGSASVDDDGHGIPVGYHPQYGDVNRLELALTRLHA